MKLTEIRIGNWVMGNVPYQLDLRALNTHAGYLRMNKPGYFDPIPLTEEWLINLGFKKWRWCDDCAYIKCNGSYLFLRKYKGEWISYITTIKKEYTEDAESGATNFNIKNAPEFVHQVQNLFFELEGRELEIT